MPTDASCFGAHATSAPDMVTSAATRLNLNRDMAIPFAWNILGNLREVYNQIEEIEARFAKTTSFARASDAARLLMGARSFQVPNAACDRNSTENPGKRPPRSRDGNECSGD